METAWQVKQVKDALLRAWRDDSGRRFVHTQLEPLADAAADVDRILEQFARDCDD